MEMPLLPVGGPQVDAQVDRALRDICITAGKTGGAMGIGLPPQGSNPGKTALFNSRAGGTGLDRSGRIAQINHHGRQPRMARSFQGVVHVRFSGFAVKARGEKRDAGTGGGGYPFPPLLDFHLGLRHCLGHLFHAGQGPLALPPMDRLSHFLALAVRLGRNQAHIKKLGEVGKKPVLAGFREAIGQSLL